MKPDGQKITKLTYEDPVIVQGYINRNSLHPNLTDLIVAFSKNIPGEKVLDLGCGPGHNSYIFSVLGFDATGLDYSHEMIRQAKLLRKVEKSPHFVVGNMKKLPTYFSENTFDAIWACASLLHIRVDDLPNVLLGINYVAKDGAKVFVNVKGGSGTKTVQDDKLGKPMQREFTLWSKEGFLEQTKPFGWKLDSFFSEEGSLFQGEPTEWLKFFFTINKYF